MSCDPCMSWRRVPVLQQIPSLKRLDLAHSSYRRSGHLWLFRGHLQSVTGALVCEIALSFFKPPSESDVMPEGPSFPVCSTFVQELFQAQYRYEPGKRPPCCLLTQLGAV